MLIVWRLQGAGGAVKMRDLETPWQTSNAFVKSSWYATDEF